MIKLINNYYIDADSYQYILKQMVKRTKKEDNSTYEAEITIGYFSNIPALIKNCLNQCIKDKVSTNKITNLKDLADQIQSIYNELNSMLNPLDIKKLSDKIIK
jgi:hypothetical protein